MTNPKRKKQISINLQQTLNITNNQSYSNKHYLFFDHVTKDSFPTIETKTSCLTIIYCKKGAIMYDYAGKTYKAKKQDLIILNTKEKFICKKTYCEYEGMAFMVANEDILSLPFQIQNSFQLKKNLGAKPIISLNYQDCNIFSALFYQSIELLSNANLNEEEKEEKLHEITQTIFNDLILSHCNTYSYKQPLKDQKTEKIAIAFKEYIDKNLFIHKNQKQFLENFNNQNKQFTSKNATYCFKECYGIYPAKYINLLKISLAIQELQKHRNMSIKKLAQQLSYSSLSCFCRSFKKALGESPHKFKIKEAEQQHRTIRHTILVRIYLQVAPLETYTQGDSIPHPS